MDPKEYLRQYEEMILKIKRIESSIQQLSDAATSITAACEGDRVQSSGTKDRTGNLVAMICDKKDEKLELIEDALNIMHEIEDVINQIEEEKQRAILHLRYIGLLKWEDIARTMNYEVSWIYTIHGKALRQVGNIINKKESSKK